MSTCLIAMLMFGCTQASQTSHNISKEADNFNVTRRLVVVNGRTDAIIYEMIGRFSFELDEAGSYSRIVAVVEADDGVYKKISVGLPEEAFWFVDDLSGAEVSTHRYEVNILPQQLIPFEFTSND